MIEDAIEKLPEWLLLTLAGVAGLVVAWLPWVLAALRLFHVINWSWWWIAAILFVGWYIKVLSFGGEYE